LTYFQQWDNFRHSAPGLINQKKIIRHFHQNTLRAMHFSLSNIDPIIGGL